MKPARLPAGFLGFYKGMRAKIVQSILAAALLMAIKEQLTTATAAVLDPKVTFHASHLRHVGCAWLKHGPSDDQVLAAFPVEIH